MARTISTSITGPVVLGTGDTPLTITSTGSVTSTGSGADGIDGAAGTTWTIANYGKVASSLGDGVALTGAGMVTNTGSISGITGLYLRAGGSVTNNTGGSLSGTGAVGLSPVIGSGVFINGASGTVTNNATISGGGYGVALGRGGFVTNNNSIVGGEDGVIVQNGAGTVANYSKITATVDDGVGLFSGGSVTNAAGASISALGTNVSAAGVFITGASGTITNGGSIAGNKFGALLTTGGSVTNNTGGSMSGKTAGVFFTTGGTLINAGTITATAAGSAGADLEAGGSVTNNTGGSISGGNFGVFATGGLGTVANSGRITSAKYGAVALEAGGSVTNAAGGVILGTSTGVYVGPKGSGTVTNSGSISATATAGAGVDLAAGGQVTNNSAGSISGSGFGVFVTGAPGTVTNAGSIGSSADQHGVGLEAGGSVTNAAGASISGQSAGVFIQGGAATLSNTGTITATAAGGAGADIEGGGSVTNNAGGSISGTSFGVFLTGGSGTVTNAGTISGGSYSVSMATSATNRLVVDPGAVFKGAVNGGTGTLELASGIGSIGGVGNGSFLNFQSLFVDPGATWTLNNTNAVPNVTDNGTVAIASSLDVSTAINSTSTGLFQLDGGSTFEVAAALGAQTQMSFLGSGSKLVIDNVASFGTNVGTTSYAGSLLENFGSGDTIDIKNFAAAGAALNYNASNGLLQISNGAQVASLDFQTSSLGSGTFNAASDGATGILITEVAIPGRTISTTTTGPVALGTADNPLTITSTGSVTSTGSGADGIDGVAGTTWTISNAGKVASSLGNGVSLAGAGMVTNIGSISGILGLRLSAGGSITNKTGGSISGQTAGVLLTAGGTLINTGTVSATATGSAGADLEAGGSVTNNTGGSILGSNFGVFATGALGTVANSGQITGAKYGGVDLAAGGSVTNAAGASISGGTTGVYAGTKGAVTVTNSGTISASATSSAGVDLAGGGQVTNNSSGLISGSGFGVFFTGASGTVTNAGSIGGSADQHGVGLEAGGTVTNAAGASISGQTAGVFTSGGAGTLNNTGTISAAAAGGAGADLEGGGSVTNNAGGSISGSAFGVFLEGGSGTVTNAGTISGGSYSVFMANSATNRLVVDPGAVFNGAINGGGGTLELATGSGSVGGIDTSFSFHNFQSLAVDAGGSWTLNGADTAPNVTDNGTVAIASSLNATAINPSGTGLFQIDGGATFEVGAATGSQTQMSFLGGSSKLVIDNAGSFGTNVGTTSYAGSQLQNFAAGDTIDLKSFAFTGAALNFDSSKGLLQISNGTQHASLNFQTSSLGSGAFHVAGDGASGILITHA